MDHFNRESIGFQVGFHSGTAMMEATIREAMEARELQSFCERLTVLCKDELIELEDVEHHLPKDSLYQTSEESIEESETVLGGNEKEQIIQALQDSHFHRETAAEKLGMSRTTLWRKLKQYNIKTK